MINSRGQATLKGALGVGAVAVMVQWLLKTAQDQLVFAQANNIKEPGGKVTYYTPQASQVPDAVRHHRGRRHHGVTLFPAQVPECVALDNVLNGKGNPGNHTISAADRPARTAHVDIDIESAFNCLFAKLNKQDSKKISKEWLGKFLDELRSSTERLAGRLLPEGMKPLVAAIKNIKFTFKEGKPEGQKDLHLGLGSGKAVVKHTKAGLFQAAAHDVVFFDGHHYTDKEMTQAINTLMRDIEHVLGHDKLFVSQATKPGQIRKASK